MSTTSSPCLLEAPATDVAVTDLVELAIHDQGPNILLEGQDGRLSPMLLTPPSMAKAVGWRRPLVLLRTLRTMARLARKPRAETDRLWGVPADSYFRRLQLPEPLTTLLVAAFAEGSFEMTSDRVPAAAAILMMQRAGQDTAMMYPRGGIGSYFDAVSSVITETGGMVLSGTAVTSIDASGRPCCG